MQFSVFGSVKPKSFPKLPYITDQILIRFFQFKINCLGGGDGKPCRNPRRDWFSGSGTGEEWVEGPYQDRKSIMKTLCKKTKVRYFRFHALRHLGASVLDRANVNLGSIQRILGHENRTTTEIYLHSIGESEREAMKVFEKAFQESHISPT